MAMFSTLIAATTPQTGDVAPDFVTQDIDGAEVALSKALDRGPLVLAFFPKAFTPG